MSFHGVRSDFRPSQSLIWVNASLYPAEQTLRVSIPCQEWSHSLSLAGMRFHPFLLKPGCESVSRDCVHLLRE